MAGRKKNPINDIINTAGAWLGGSRGAATNPQVRAAMDATRAIGKVVDTATGGFGQAAVDDARRMAASGSSTPSALYKTAAVNLATAALGAAAAQVASKAAGKVVSARASKATKAITPTNLDRVVFHAGSDPLAAGPLERGYKAVHQRPGLPNVHMGTEGAAVSRQGERVGVYQQDVPLLRKSSIDRYEIMNPKAVSRRWFLDNAFTDEEYLADLTETQSKRYVQYFDDQPTRKNKILRYINLVEDRDSVSYLVPKSRVESGDVAYRGSKQFSNQLADGQYTSPELNRLRDIQQRISANQSRITAAGAVSGVVVPKKKNRGGRKNKN